MIFAELKAFLGKLGVPEENLEAMASQLEKRALQLAEERQQPYEETLAHLIHLLKQGWAAKQRKID